MQKLTVVMTLLGSMGLGAAGGRDLEPSSMKDYANDALFVKRYSEAASLIAKRKVREIVDAGFSPRLATGGAYNGYFLWDSVFCVLWARYLPAEFPVYETLDNFYRFAEPDGYIGRQFDAEGRPVWNPQSTMSFSPPLLAWAEWELYRTTTTGVARLARVYPALVRHHQTLERFRRTDGLYYSDALGCGMDELPRHPHGMSVAEKMKGGVVLTIDAVMPYARKGRWEWLKPKIPHFSWNRQAGWIDTSSQVALDCLSLSEIATALGKEDEAVRWKAKHADLAKAINALCWDDTLGFYCDRSGEGTIPRCHAGAFWVLLSRVATSERAAKMVTAFADPARFGRPVPLPCLPKNDPDYRPENGYWCGGVWPPTNYVAIRGLLAYGYRNLAESIARKWYNANAELWVRYGTVFENLSPEQCMEKRSSAQKDFCGWGALAPIALPREFGWLK